ncbi:MAG TPA: hypothetical protein VN812_01480 [Candidatus Acidoferrales bacterium]|nr:hypothetical protein [Candidatus Acidoferrales bacterium]
MKVWVMAAVGMVVVNVAAQAAPPNAQTIKDDSGRLLATLALCSDCQSAGGKACHTGVEHGWLDGQACGKCLLDANYGWHYQSSRGLVFVGTLTDAAGQPVKDRYVKLFVANGWSVRGRTSDDGSFRLMLGSTEPGAAKKSVATDIGRRIDTPTNNDPKSSYAMYLLPAPYKPCSAPPTPAPAQDHGHKQEK